MTCIDAYLRDHPGVASYYSIKTHNKLPGGCPGGYGYLDDPSWCNTDGTKCYLCWLREIPENEEKENENMSDAVTINYEARCEQHVVEAFLGRDILEED